MSEGEEQQTSSSSEFASESNAPRRTPSIREGRKQLPAIPDPQSQAAMSANQKRLPVIKSGTKGNGYGQYFTEYSLMAEYELLMKQKCPGCYVMPSALTPNKWYGILFIRQGLYQEGVFKFTLTIPDNFPDGDCPVHNGLIPAATFIYLWRTVKEHLIDTTLVFSFPVFHPLVDPQTGELDVKRAFTKWRKNSNHIWQVLRYARLAFYKIDCKQPWNEEAANICETDAELYKKRVQETINVSKERIQDPVKSDDPHELRVSPMDTSVFSETRDKMMNAKRKPSDVDQMNRGRGLSWMKEGSVKIFSREDSALA